MVKLLLPLVVMIVGGIVVWIVAAYIKVRTSAKTHGKWKAVASRYGLNVARSGGIDAPTLHGQVEGREVTVRPIFERVHEPSSRTRYVRTEFEIELPERVPASLGLVDTDSGATVGRAARVQPVSLGLEDLYEFRGGRRLVEELLDAEDVVDRLFDLHEYASDIELEERRLWMSVAGQMRGDDEIEQGLEHLVATADAIGDSFGGGDAGEGRHW